MGVACEQAVGRAGWGEGKALSLPFPRYFSPNREPVHRLAWEANPSRVMKRKVFEKEVLDG